MTRPLTEFDGFPALPDPVAEAAPIVSRTMSLPSHIEPNSFEAAEWQQARIIVEFGALRPAQWPLLIAEILIEPSRTAEICERYATTPDDVMLLLKHNKHFQSVVKEIKARIEKAGADNGFVLRAQLVAEELLPELRDVAKDKMNTGPTRVRAIENAMELAGYKNPGGGGGNGTVAPGAGTTGVVMNVTFGAGIPQVDALKNVDATTTTIKMTPIATEQGQPTDVEIPTSTTRETDTADE